MIAHDVELWSYAAGELEVDEHRLVQSHLEECPECLDELRAIQVARQTLELAGLGQPRVDWNRADGRMGTLVEKRLRAQARRPVLRRLAFGGGVLAAAAMALTFVSLPKTTVEIDRPVLVNEPSIPVSSWARVDRAQGLTRVNGGAALGDGTELQGGDVIRTSKKGHAFLHLPDSSHLRVGGASQVALTRSEGDDVALTLERGRLAVRASHQARKDFVVHSGGVAVHVVGTVFAVANDAQSVEVSVSEGKVRVELPNGETTFVEPGERLRLDTSTLNARRLKLNPLTERELAEVMAADETASAVEQQAMVPAVGGGTPSAPPMLNAQGTPRTLPRLSAKDAQARIVTPPSTTAEAPAEANAAAPAGMDPTELAVLAPAPKKPDVLVEAPQDVWPTLGGGEIMRGVPERRAPSSNAQQFEPPPASAPDEWATVPQPAVKSVARLDEEEAPLLVAPAPAPVPVPKKSIARDLESLFLERAESSMRQGGCEQYLLGLEDLALDPDKNDRTEEARVLRARCFNTQLRPHQALAEYRKYLQEYPTGHYLAEARAAFGQ